MRAQSILETRFNTDGNSPYNHFLREEVTPLLSLPRRTKDFLKGEIKHLCKLYEFGARQSRFRAYALCYREKY